MSVNPSVWGFLFLFVKLNLCQHDNKYLAHSKRFDLLQKLRHFICKLMLYAGVDPGIDALLRSGSRNLLLHLGMNARMFFLKERIFTSNVGFQDEVHN
jgi:hypothetical protein